MQQGDKVLFYHSVTQPGVVGIATVQREHYPDPTATDDPRWVVVDLVADHALPQKVTLASIKNNALLSQMLLVRHSRLSVMPVTEAEYNEINRMAYNEGAAH